MWCIKKIVIFFFFCMKPWSGYVLYVLNMIYYVTDFFQFAIIDYLYRIEVIDYFVIEMLRKVMVDEGSWISSLILVWINWLASISRKYVPWTFEGDFISSGASPDPFRRALSFSIKIFPPKEYLFRKILDHKIFFARILSPGLFRLFILRIYLLRKCKSEIFNWFMKTWKEGVWNVFE